MPASLVLLSSGVLLLAGGVFFAVKRRWKIAVVCLVGGAALMAVFPVLVMTSSM